MKRTLSLLSQLSLFLALTASALAQGEPDGRDSHGGFAAPVIPTPGGWSFLALLMLLLRLLFGI
jgi:hypothetical protein